MVFRLLLLLVSVPFFELALLLILADMTSWWCALLAIVVTGVAGWWLIRSQGFQTLQQIRQEFTAGRVPTDALLDAVFILAAGLLLLTPGMLTDVLAISLLLPPCRRRYRTWLLRWFKSRFTARYASFAPGEASAGNSRVIDACVSGRSSKKA